MPPKQRALELLFPVKGLDRSYAFQKPPQYTFADARDVRPWNAFEKRIGSGGQRPGFMKPIDEQIGSTGVSAATVIRMMATCKISRTDGKCHFGDSFFSTSMGSWGSFTSSFAYLQPSIDTVRRVAYDAAYATGEKGALQAIFSPARDSTRDQQVSMLMAPRDNLWGSSYAMYMSWTDAASPAGLRIKLTNTAGVWTGVITNYHGGAAADTHTISAFTVGKYPTWVRARLSITAGPTYTLTVYVDGVLVKTQVLVSITNWSTGLAGFSLLSLSTATAQISDFTVEYYTTEGAATDRPRTLLLESANGILYRESWFGTMETVSSSLTLAGDRKIFASDRLSTLRIADTGDLKASGTNGTTDGAGTGFDSASYADWTTLGLNVNDYMVLITSGTGVTVGLYAITTIAAGTITLSTSAGAGATNIVFRIERCAKKYTESAGTGSLTRWTATSGQVPIGCKFISTYRDRMVFSGARNAPQAWYMSKQADPDNWDYTAAVTDEQRAVAGVSSTAGQIGEPITFQAAWRDDFLIWGTANSLYILRGDPASGGQIDKVPTDFGVVTNAGACFDARGGLFFISFGGLAYMPPDGSGASLISEAQIPRELLGLDSDNYEVSMAYDRTNNGVHITISEKAVFGSVSNKNVLQWWYDLTVQGFFPDRYGNDVMAMLWYDCDVSSQACVLFGCRDGYTRRLHRLSENDNGIPIYSYVEIGPINLGNNDSDGAILSLNGVLASWSGQADWAIRVNETAESALTTTAIATGKWIAGRNYGNNPRAGGDAAYLRVQWGVIGVTGSFEGMTTWAFDCANLRIETYVDVPMRRL